MLAYKISSFSKEWNNQTSRDEFRQPYRIAEKNFDLHCIICIPYVESRVSDALFRSDMAVNELLMSIQDKAIFVMTNILCLIAGIMK